MAHRELLEIYPKILKMLSPTGLNPKELSNVQAVEILEQVDRWEREGVIFQKATCTPGNICLTEHNPRPIQQPIDADKVVREIKTLQKMPRAPFHH